MKTVMKKSVNMNNLQNVREFCDQLCNLKMFVPKPYQINAFFANSFGLGPHLSSISGKMLQVQNLSREIIFRKPWKSYGKSFCKVYGNHATM